MPKLHMLNHFYRLTRSRDEVKYVTLPIEEQKEGASEYHQAPKRTNTHFALISIIIGSIGIIAVLAAWYSLTTQSHEINWISCGNTSQEARAANCHYEPMQRSWIPDACYFEEPASEYDPFSDRAWFSDKNRTIPADLDRLRTGDDYVAFTKYFHDEHCVYTWRKLALATQQGRKLIDTKTYDIEHVTHCSKRIANILVESEQKDYKGSVGYTESPLMFQGCVALN